MTLTDLEMKVWNQGERLIPGRTHNADEARRHRSSYALFRRVIESDIQANAVKKPTILDLGFGCGFGCATLASIPNSTVIAIDISEDCLEYAALNYSMPNISYKTSDIANFLKGSDSKFDYIVSRGVLEHIDQGLDLVMHAEWKMRLMFDVPYAEPPNNNHHHVLSNITEKDFSRWPDIEILYEDLVGGIHRDRPPKPNMIMGALKNQQLDAIADILSFPMAPA